MYALRGSAYKSRAANLGSSLRFVALKCKQIENKVGSLRLVRSVSPLPSMPTCIFCAKIVPGTVCQVVRKTIVSFTGSTAVVPWYARELGRTDMYAPRRLQYCCSICVVGRPLARQGYVYVFRYITRLHSRESSDDRQPDFCVSKYGAFW